MKKAFLILMMLVLPLQTLAAAERTLTHLLGAGHGPDMRIVLQHMLQHADLVPHHHDDDHDHGAGDGTTHVDGSQKSLQHLADHEQGGGAYMALPASPEACLPAVLRLAPLFRLDAYPERTTSPLLRPPRSRA
ncbi:hypothetical protein GTP91_32380 [Rugamonas sp. FT82W]|uniref:Cobalt transporter n=1 Tax=Duganella vulcania TaxID=2692166 RepID=A0A845GD76_9BURK|nr:hypothetical protein [Duganella vulcania]MYM91861.1 hypothetical protein [Duganella vulcania]